VNWNQGSSDSENFPKSGTEGSLNLLLSKDQNGFFEESLLKGSYTQPLPVSSVFEKKKKGELPKGSYTMALQTNWFLI
jgi:hypothetical protein